MTAGNFRPAAPWGRYRSAASVTPSGIGMRTLRTTSTAQGPTVASGINLSLRDDGQNDVRGPVPVEADRVVGRRQSRSWEGFLRGRVNRPAAVDEQPGRGGDDRFGGDEDEQ